MKRSQLREIVLEAMRGYSPQVGQTKGGTTDDFRNILTAIAKERPEEDSEEASARRGHASLDKANPENVARILRGEKPIYEAGSNLSASDIQEFVKQTLNLRDYDVTVRLSPTHYNEIKLTIKQDPSEEGFNTIINYLEDNGYTIDRVQTQREGESEDDNYNYPRIVFR